MSLTNQWILWLNAYNRADPLFVVRGFATHFLKFLQNLTKLKKIIGPTTLHYPRPVRSANAQDRGRRHKYVCNSASPFPCVIEIHLLSMHLYLTCSLLWQVRLYGNWCSSIDGLQICPWHIIFNVDEEKHHCWWLLAGDLHSVVFSVQFDLMEGVKPFPHSITPRSSPSGVLSFLRQYL